MNLAWSVWLPLSLAVGGEVPPAEQKVNAFIAHLDSPYFVKREDATRDLIDLGYPALPALRRARGGSTDRETRQRLDRIIAAIEQQDVSRTALHRLADRLRSANDDQLVEALYLVALSRSASAEERAQAVRSLSRGRQQAIADLIVRLRETKGGDSTFLDAQLRMIDAKTRILTSDPVPLTALNDLAKALGPKLAAVTQDMTDDQELASLFLVTLQRYPTAADRRQMFRYRQKQPNRQDYVVDVVWALMNSGEFLDVR